MFQSDKNLQEDKVSARYERALLREKKARRCAEDLLENKSREIFEAKQRIESQYEELLAKSIGLELLNELVNFAQGDASTQEAIHFFVSLCCKKFNWLMGCAYFSTSHISNNDHGLIYLDESLEDNKLDMAKFCQDRYGLVEGEYLSLTELSWYDFEMQGFFAESVLQGAGVVNILVIPIYIYKRVFATVEFFTMGKALNEKLNIDMLDTAAMQLGTVLDRRQAEDKIKENYEDLKKTMESLKKTQYQLLQSEKMASVGQLAAGVAHEINNPIAYVLSNINSIQQYVQIFEKLNHLYDNYHQAVIEENIADKQRYEQKILALKKEEDIDFMMQDLDELLADTLEGGARVKEIVQGLKDFSHVDSREKSWANINDCLQSTLKMVNNEIKYKCDISTEYSDLPDMLCYPGQLNQVFMNLLVNAGQSIDTKGLISVKTFVENNNIVIVIKDTGKGIKAEHIKELFTPFFTTKPVGQGTGLGLSISYGIIQDHGGTISVTSTEGKGTCFTITLPV